MNNKRVSQTGQQQSVKALKPIISKRILKRKTAENPKIGLLIMFKSMINSKWTVKRGRKNPWDRRRKCDLKKVKSEKEMKARVGRIREATC